MTTPGNKVSPHIDVALDNVLRAAGSALGYFETRYRDAMREAMRKALSDAYIQGSNDNYAAMKRSAP